MFEYRRDFNHIRQVAPRVRVAQSNIQVLITIIRYFPSELCWLGDRKDIRSVKAVVKVFFFKFVKQGAHLTKPGWSKPHTHSNPTNLAFLGIK